MEIQDVVGGRRCEGLCPVCHSTDRERLLYLFFIRKIPQPWSDHARVLHVAPEPGLRRWFQKQTRLKYRTADLDPVGVDEAMDITRIDYPDDHFDAIICNHVLEHVVHDRKALSELKRVLKPDGWAILQVPLAMNLSQTYEDESIRKKEAREQAFGQWNHVRLYGRDYAKRLEEAGFNVQVFDWTEYRDEFGGAGNPYGLNEREKIFTVACVASKLPRPLGEQTSSSTQNRQEMEA